MTSTLPRLAFLRNAPLECTPITSLVDGAVCNWHGADLAILRVYGADMYAECCEECGPWAVSLAVRSQPDWAGPVRVEVAASVWAARDDEEGCGA